MFWYQVSIIPLHQITCLCLNNFFPDPELFFSVLNSFYGVSIPCTDDNFHLLRTIALTLKYHKLEAFLQDKIKSGFVSCEFQLDSSLIVSELVKSAVRDVFLTYNQSTVTINSTLLSCFSTHFNNLFNGQFRDSLTRNFQYSSEFPGVEEDVFVTFFNAALCHSISFTSSNVISFYQLSVYFQVKKLDAACLSFLRHSSFPTKF
ncbi:hypothetical protein GEMRC1_002799 [Eukaryota sp. GEM-RC1]